MMTLRRAMPILVVAGVFDAVRAFFQFFWFFGPALAATLCTVGLNSYIGTTLAESGGKLVGGLCAATATVAGVLGVEITAPFGVIMADAVGLLAFLTLGLSIVIVNRRILATVSNGPLQFAAAFALGEIPFLGALPVFTIIIWRLYKAQIKVEKAALKKWEEEQATLQLQERSQQQQAEQAQYQQYQVAEQEEQQVEAVEQVQAEEGVQKERGAQETSMAPPGAMLPDAGQDVETDFDILQDALSELNSKQNRTTEDNVRLTKAHQIMQDVSISSTDKNDPVLLAAYERARMGQRPYRGGRGFYYYPENNRVHTDNGFRFSNVTHM